MRIDGVRYRRCGQTVVDGVTCDLLVPVDGRGPLRAEPVESVSKGNKGVSKAGVNKAAGDDVGDNKCQTGKSHASSKIGGKQAEASTAPAAAAEVGRALAATAARYRWPLWLLAVLGVLGALLGCGGHGG